MLRGGVSHDVLRPQVEALFQVKGRHKRGLGQPHMHCSGLGAPLREREVINWLMWQMGSAPFMGGGFGHFYRYAPVHIEYAINRYSMETKRLLDVLDKQLDDKDNSLLLPYWGPPSL